MFEHAPMALAGGALVGLAAALLLLVHGRVLGVSGIVNGVFDRALEGEKAGHGADLDWRIALLVGLIGGAALTAFLIGVPTPRVGFPGGVLVLAGLLVGFGTRLGSGCTSGHGICGIARFSPRSMVATTVFVGVAMVTVFLLRHALGVLA